MPTRHQPPFPFSCDAIEFRNFSFPPAPTKEKNDCETSTHVEAFSLGLKTLQPKTEIPTQMTVNTAA